LLDHFLLYLRPRGIPLVAVVMEEGIPLPVMTVSVCPDAPSVGKHTQESVDQELGFAFGVVSLVILLGDAPI
jgi:hypothetical protein